MRPNAASARLQQSRTLKVPSLGSVSTTNEDVVALETAHRSKISAVYCALHVPLLVLEQRSRRRRHFDLEPPELLNNRGVQHPGEGERLVTGGQRSPRWTVCYSTEHLSSCLRAASRPEPNRSTLVRKPRKLNINIREGGFLSIFSINNFVEVFWQAVILSSRSFCKLLFHRKPGWIMAVVGWVSTFPFYSIPKCKPPSNGCMVEFLNTNTK